MDLHLWLAFVAASAAIGAIPGPAVTSIVGYALGSGRKVALASVGGMVVGNLICMTLSMAGVGAILAASALAFSMLKWAGALYLIGLGLWTLWKARRLTVEHIAPPPPISARAAFMSNVALGMSSTRRPSSSSWPFAPQFIGAHAAYWPQAAILIVTFASRGRRHGHDLCVGPPATRVSAAPGRPKTLL